MGFFKCSEEGIGDPERIRQFMGPHSADQMLRHAIQACWMMAQAEREADPIAFVEAEIRRMADRAIRQFREDATAFDAGKPE